MVSHIECDIVRVLNHLQGMHFHTSNQSLVKFAYNIDNNVYRCWVSSEYRATDLCNITLVEPNRVSLLWYKIGSETKGWYSSDKTESYDDVKTLESDLQWNIGKFVQYTKDCQVEWVSNRSGNEKETKCLVKKNKIL